MEWKMKNQIWNQIYNIIEDGKSNIKKWENQIWNRKWEILYVSHNVIYNLVFALNIYYIQVMFILEINILFTLYC